MRSTFAGLALVALVAAKPVPQSSSSCSDSYSGTFKIQVIKTGSKVKRQSGDTDLELTLSGGKLLDQDGRTGYIAANKQFQFDSPVQAGALQTSGFSVCDGDLLAHSGITTWDQCLSGDFYNLYSDNTIAAGNPGQCEEINIQVIGGGSASGSAPAPATTSAPVTQITDGQPQASTALSAPVTQISDGQIQATTATPVAPITVISDGQPQAPTTTATPVAPVTQISDGQVQAPTSTVAPVAPCTQIVDGQPQCPTSTPYGTGAVAPTGTGVVPYPSGSIVPAIGGAAANGPVVGLLAAAGLAAAFL